MQCRNKIGVIDSGIGGFTVVKELRKLLPNESIVFFGDNLNCPYGNKSKKEIIQLTLNMLDFLNKKQVKLVCIACNTISTLIEDYRDKYEFPILDIITPTVDFIIDAKIDNIGILGTTFTIKTGSYEKMLLYRNSNIELISESLPNLAALIDKGDFDSDVIKDEVRYHLHNITNRNEVLNLILACTHYPIIEDIFKAEAPNLNIINPAIHLAEKIRQTLQNDNMSEDDKNMDTTIEIFTTGNAEGYKKITKKLKIENKISINII